MKLLIVGATGATGERIVRQLLDDGHVVTITVLAGRNWSGL